MDAWRGEAVIPPVFHPRGCQQLAFHPRGDQIAIGSRHRETSVWDLRPGSIQPLHIPMDRSLWRVVFSQDESALITLDYRGQAQRWDATTGEQISEAVDYGPDFVAGLAGTTHSLNNGLQTDRWYEAQYLPGMLGERFGTGSPQSAAASTDGQWLVTGSKDGLIHVWDVAQGELSAPPLTASQESITAVAISSSGQYVLAGDARGRVLIWAWQDGQVLFDEDCHAASVTTGSFATGYEGLAATGSEDGTARLYRRSGTSYNPGSPLEQGAHVTNIAFSQDNKLLATSGLNNEARIWSTDDGHQLGRPMRHIDRTSEGLFIHWLPNHRQLVTSRSHDNTARVWDVHLGKMTTRPLEHSMSTRAAAVRPDGGAFIFAEGTIRVWDLETGAPLTRSLSIGQEIFATAFAPSGQRFAGASWNQGAYIWDLVDVEGGIPDALLDYAEALGGFRFNEEGVLEQVPPRDLPNRRLALQAVELPHQPSLTRWRDWLTTAPNERTFSPWSAVHFHDHVEQLIETGDRESLLAALRWRPGDPAILSALGETMATGSNATPSSRRYGAFLTKRALKKNPNRLAFQLAHARSAMAAQGFEQGLRALAKPLESNATSAEVLLTCGSILEDRGWLTEAALFYDQARHQSEDDTLRESVASGMERIRKRFPSMLPFEEGVSQSRVSSLQHLARSLASDPRGTRLLVTAASMVNEASSDALDWQSLGESALLLADRETVADLQRPLLSASLVALTCGEAPPERIDYLCKRLADIESTQSPPPITFVPRSSVWAYLDGETTRSHPPHWTKADFDDELWKRGPAPLGYGNGDEVTQTNPGNTPSNKPPSTLFRHRFTLGESPLPKQVRVRFQCDDGLVAHLNGEAWFRFNMPDESLINGQTHARAVVNGTNETRWFERILPTKNLVPGQNTLAVSVHQVSAGSSDARLHLELTEAPLSASQWIASFDIEEVAKTLLLDAESTQSMRQAVGRSGS